MQPYSEMSKAVLKYDSTVYSPSSLFLLCTWDVIGNVPNSFYNNPGKKRPQPKIQIKTMSGICKFMLIIK